MRAYLALVVQKVDSAVPRINYYPLDSDLSGRQRYLACSRRLDSGVWREGVKEQGKIRRMRGG